MSSWPQRYAPLLLFAVTYTVSCLIGAVLMLVGYDSFTVLYEYFSGTDVPVLEGERLAVTLALLLAAPVLFAAGYGAALRLPAGRLPGAAERRLGGTEPPAVPLLPWLVFALLAAIAFVSIVRAGGIDDARSWLDYGAWVSARRRLLEEMSFGEFVNVYLAVPLAAAWILLSGQRSLRTWAGIARIVPVGVVVALELLLFQRKAAIVAVLLMLFAVTVDAVRRGQRVRVPIAVGAAALAALYFALVVVPVYSDTARTVEQAAAADPPLPPPAASGGEPQPGTPGAVQPIPETPQQALEREQRLQELGAKIDLENRGRSIVLYSLISPLTRTSAPALYYPIVYPKLHSFHGLDVGLDVLGYGVMPNDNVVVWHVMNPTIAGTTMVPFAFVLYSQVGLAGALVLSFVVGGLLALLWRAVRVPWLARTWSALLAALVLLLGVYLAIDSARNATLVSYGVVWGFVFVAAAMLLTRAAAAVVRLTPRR